MKKSAQLYNFIYREIDGVNEREKKGKGGGGTRLRKEETLIEIIGDSFSMFQKI